MSIQDHARIVNMEYIYNCNDTEALWMLRMKRAPFVRLVQMFKSRGLLEDSIHAVVEEQVVMFLHVVGHNQRLFRVIHKTFKRSMETIIRYFMQVLYAVGELREEMIGICIGAIDGTHVTARVSRSQSVAYRGRKQYTSQNVLVAIDFDLKFTYVLAGWEG
ncbi:uncharacterized protein [Aegilops tauschii subsp. strangulata]|uniref:uncharacterized protein n=1 Tax=Aegilops tauschii subsp. strangulata TaxID=200361 RepID=UPI003CC8A045